MTNPATGEDLRAFEVRGDESLELLVQELLMGAYAPRTWLLFLDGNGRLMDPIFPIDDVPRDHAVRLHDAELGDVTHAELMAHRAAVLARLIRADTVVLVWERPGRHRVSGSLGQWIDAIVAAAPGAGLPLRGQVLLTSTGARVVPADRRAG